MEILCLCHLFNLQLFHYESTNYLEPELQENASWGAKLSAFSKTEVKGNVFTS